jgi:Xaa-Pro aminopeptidase
MARNGLDAFLVSVPENRYYLSGYEAEDLHLTESSGHLLLTAGQAYLLTDSRYEEAARAEAPGFEVIVHGRGVEHTLPDLFSSLKTERLGVEAHYLTFLAFGKVQEALKSARPCAETVPVHDFIERLRIVKEPGEIERIVRSLRLTESALRSVWGKIAPGMREKDIAWEIEAAIRMGGGQAVSFPPIAAAGPNAALPHAVPTNREVRPGDPVILDLGAKLDMYCSDMTRTWVGGHPEPRLAEIYRIVRLAQLAGQYAIGPGKSSAEVDSAARNLITEAGYGECFGHGLGHGVGLAVHEGPGLRRRDPVILEENMVVTVEPGIYIPGYGGVRLENLVRVTSSGCEQLSTDDFFYEW